MTITVVLGMHRSGTSALAKLLSRLGLASGDRLLPANEHNADGHFEDIDVLAVDEAVLKRLGTVWHLPLNPGRMEKALESGELSEELAQAARLVKDRTARYPNWFVKEPRLSLLMPFWQRVFADQGVSARYVWMIRNPVQVDASLRARDQLGSIHNTQTWLAYQGSILSAVQGRATYLLDYETLLSDQTDWWSGFTLFLGLGLDSDETSEAFRNSVSKDLYRQRLLTSNENSLALALYSDLKNAQPGMLDKARLADLWDRWSPQLKNLLAPWDWASDLDLKNRDLLVQVRDLGEAAQQNLIQAQSAKVQVQSVQAEMEAIRVASERLAVELTAEQGRLTQARAEVVALEEETEQLQASRAALQDQVLQLNARIDQLQIDLEGLNAQFLTTRELLKHAEQGIADREDQLALVLNSTSWKLTKPLRWLKKLVAGR